LLLEEKSGLNPNEKAGRIMANEQWDFDVAHSSINFSVRHLMVSKVRGQFTKWSGSLEFDEQEPTRARVEAQLDAASIDTKDAQRDAHLRSADFLDTERFPTISFKSTGIEKVGDARFSMKGELTIRGITKPVTLDVEYAGRAKDPWGGERVGFSARTSIDRKDFGLTWNQLLETGGVLVGEKVDIELEIEAIRRKSA
jgi:polyisoprenoid-binding protein YceI